MSIQSTGSGFVASCRKCGRRVTEAQTQTRAQAEKARDEHEAGCRR